MTHPLGSFWQVACADVLILNKVDLVSEAPSTVASVSCAVNGKWRGRSKNHRLRPSGREQRPPSETSTRLRGARVVFSASWPDSAWFSLTPPHVPHLPQPFWKGSLKAVLLKCHGLGMPRCQQAWCDLWQLRPLGDILGLQAFDKDRMALGTTLGWLVSCWPAGLDIRVCLGIYPKFDGWFVDDSIFCPLSGIAYFRRKPYLNPRPCSICTFASSLWGSEKGLKVSTELTEFGDFDDFALQDVSMWKI